jgi:serine/threonine-protein kinase
MTELEFIIESPGERRAVAFPSTSFAIGSDDTCQLRFTEGLLMPRHAEVVRDLRGQWWIRDLVATGAVVVNGNPVLDERLAPGDKLRIGAVILQVKDTGVDKRARTVSGETPMPLGVEETPTELVPGYVIDKRYRVLGKLATGGMGEVYRAEHVELGKALALKVMLPALSGDEDFVGRFKREAIAASRIGSPNIVDISDFGRTEDGRFYFAMEFLDGLTLSKTLRKDGPFSAQRLVHVGLQAARALAAAHAQKIIHRDLKPENIMLLQRPGQPDFVKVLDFGIAKVTGAGNTGGYTAIGTVVGTPQYMSPEQASGLPVDERSDIYALGLIFHELLGGRPTFTADSAPGLMALQLKAEPPPLRAGPSPLPRDLEHLVFQMLKKSRDERPKSMQAVVEVLDSVAAFPTPTARTAPVHAAEWSPGVSALSSMAAIQPTGFEAAVAAGAKTDMLLAAQPERTGPMTPAAPTRADPVAVATRPERGVSTPAAPTTAAMTPAPKTNPPAPITDVDAVALRPKRWPLVAGLAAVVVLVGVVAIAWPRPEPVVTPPPAVVPVPEPTAPPPVVEPPPATTVKLTLTSEPERVEVYEEDVLLGTTPLTLTRPRGELTTLRFEAKGFTALTRKLRFEADTTVPVTLEKAARVKVKRPVGAPPDEELKDNPF